MAFTCCAVFLTVNKMLCVFEKVCYCKFSVNKEKVKQMYTFPAISNDQVKQLTVNFFTCKRATEISVVITALILAHKKEHVNASFTSKLTIAYNITVLENLLITARSNKYYNNDEYILELAKLR